jgi:hypothetical protein
MSQTQTNQVPTENRTQVSEKIRELGLKAIADALERNDRLVLRYRDIEDALRELVPGDEYYTIESRVYEALVEGTLRAPVYIYRLGWKENSEDEIIVVSIRELRRDEIEVLEHIDSVDRAAVLMYDEFSTCSYERRCAILEVMHNLLKLWTCSRVDMVVRLLERELSRLSDKTS